MLTPSNKAASHLLIGAALLCLTFCSKEPPMAGEVLAQIGDRVITKEDFMRRAEYTMRPDFCAGDNYIHRKIVLNSLIAEKLVALESSESPILEDPDFQTYIQGRQEQTMRQWLFKVEGRDQVDIDTSAYRAALRKSIRTYDLQFLALPDSQALSGWNRALGDGYDFDTIAKTLLNSDTIPSHSMNWFERGDDALHDHIFGASPQKGSVLDPLQLENGEYLIVKVVGWTDRPTVTNAKLGQNASDVQERLVEKQADALYRQYAASVMAGKEMQLNKRVFAEYAIQASEIYLRSSEEKEQVLNQAIWNAEEQLITASVSQGARLPGDALLFSVDGKDWTIDEFERALKRHPLVFRQRKMSYREFPKQLKFAIADLIRDEYLTQEAYTRGFDQTPNVKQATQMWQDHYVSRKTRNDWVNARMTARGDTVSGNQIRILETYMNPIVDSLQAAYGDQIKINTTLFEGLKLSSVPMLVSQRNLPFPLAVPAFPRLTTDDLLDYGQRMEGQ